MMKKHWKISEFVDELNTYLKDKSVHMNTVIGWFNRLEKDRIHSIQRTQETNEKVYDELDLKIALFIRARREEGWSITAIFNDLSNHFDTRDFPLTEESTTPAQFNFNELKKQIMAEVKEVYEEIAATQTEELREQYEKLLTQAPQPPTEQEMKQQNFEVVMLHKKVEMTLEKEALKKWKALPEDQRMRRVGFFRKEADYEKKAEFIRDFINENFEEQLQKEMNIEKR
ncbi:MerR family transcriptional regulator [Cytobacillus kochii]|uniref:MerR family transcriptional regulator n=1 Tax=Cytobacillus kochii TaxID=859143 RepID=UPI0025A0733A|nr:MerR family transcriptional regulator [Cytobacillus kochii]MDM5205313.1 MerR family transcriptional regulator [Cytobacillus kochii]